VKTLSEQWQRLKADTRAPTIERLYIVPYLRCKAGDLVVITQEEIGCEANIGQLVYVIRLVEPYSDFELLDDDWWIKSASNSPLLFVKMSESPRQFGSDCNPVKHSDRWHRPIRDPGDFVVNEMIQILSIDKKIKVLDRIL
jgi:hypothetical protein